MLPLFAAANVALYASFAYLYLFSAKLINLRPLYFYIVTVGITAVFVLFQQRFALKAKPSRRLALWSVVFSIACAGAYLWSRQGPVATSSLIIAVHETALLVAFLYLFRDPKSVAYAISAMAAVAVFGVVMNIVDFFAIESWHLSIIPGRAAGLYENPNLSGQYLVLAMVLGVWMIPRHLRSIFVLFVGVGVFLTFSRSALLAWVIGLVALIWYQAFPYRKVVVWLGAGALLVFLVGAVLVGDMAHLLESAGLTDRLNADTIGRVTGSFFSQRDMSARDRVTIAEEGLRVFMQSPLIGTGLGATRESTSAGAPHNMYIMLAAEMGLVGLMLFLTMLWILWQAKTPTARTVALVIAVSSLFTHNQLEQVAMMVVMALAISADVGHERSKYESRRPIYLGTWPTPGHSGAYMR